MEGWSPINIKKVEQVLSPILIYFWSMTHLSIWPIIYSILIQWLWFWFLWLDNLSIYNFSSGLQFIKYLMHGQTVPSSWMDNNDANLNILWKKIHNKSNKRSIDVNPVENGRWNLLLQSWKVPESLNIWNVKKLSKEADESNLPRKAMCSGPSSTILPITRTWQLQIMIFKVLQNKDSQTHNFDSGRNSRIKQELGHN